MAHPDENEIEDGIDELGVLILCHARNAYWYGLALSIEETRKIAPYQNATGMQVYVSRARRHGVGAGKSHRRHRRSRRDGFSPLPSKSRCRTLGPGEGFLHTPTGPRSATGPDCFPKTSTRRIPGNSGTCWCGEVTAVFPSENYLSLIGAAVFSAGGRRQCRRGHRLSCASSSGRAGLRRRCRRTLAAGL